MDEEVPGQHGPEKIAQSVSGRGHANVNSSNIFRAADAEMMELPEVRDYNGVLYYGISSQKLLLFQIPCTIPFCFPTCRPAERSW
jgi:hypothetical protein